jgi:hypothetical protein
MRNQNGNQNKLVPSSLPLIYQVSRRNNKCNNITGVLSYLKGYYLQVIEGEETELEATYERIRGDARHTILFEFVKTDIEKRYFPESSLSLTAAIHRDERFQAFMSDHSDHIKSEDSSKIVLLSMFYPEGAYGANHVAFAGRYLRLLAWPSLNKIDPATSMIDLCALLSSSQEKYEDIVNSKEYGTKDEIDGILLELNKGGLLSYSDKSAENGRGSLIGRSSTNFYRQMKKFLRL